MRPVPYAVHIFNTDLRIEDNIALNKNYYYQIIPIYFLSSEVCNERYTNFRNESILDLKSRCPLVILKEDKDKIENQLCLLHEIKRFEKITQNIRYHPKYYEFRDIIVDWCKRNKIIYEEYHDKTTIDYKPSYRKIFFYQVELDANYEHESLEIKNYIIKGGRRRALEHIKTYKSWCYETLDTEKGHILQPYIVHGCISIREAFGIYDHVKLFQDSLLKSIGYYIHYHNNRYDLDKIEVSLSYYSSKENLYKRWKDGETGQDLVNAIMNQYNSLGLITQYAKMITASYLTKDLGLNWHYGKKYMETMSIDYDYCLNFLEWMNVQYYSAEITDTSRSFIKKWEKISSFLSSGE